MRALGVDVGGHRKGFDVALLDDRRLVHHQARCSVAGVVDLARRLGAEIVGIDSPDRCAPDGEASRAGERALNRAVCSIRFTPDERTVQGGGSYYEWIRHGLELYGALGRALPHVPCHEVFPTASWTIWGGPRGSTSRAAWSRGTLAGIGLRGVPARTSQDLRDAIAAALTAAEHRAGRTLAYGGIIVPRVH